jgi:hypothetical protein
VTAALALDLGGEPVWALPPQPAINAPIATAPKASEISERFRNPLVLVFVGCIAEAMPVSPLRLTVPEPVIRSAACSERNAVMWELHARGDPDATKAQTGPPFPLDPTHRSLMVPIRTRATNAGAPPFPSADRELREPMEYLDRTCFP